MARTSSSRSRKNDRLRYSPTSRPSTRTHSDRQDVSSDSEPPGAETNIDPPSTVQRPSLGSIPEVEASATQLTTASFTSSICPSTFQPQEYPSPSLHASLPDQTVYELASLTSSYQARAQSTPISLSTTTPTSAASRGRKKRDGVTKVYLNGYEYTRSNATPVKISYRCSYYRKPKLCPGKLIFYAATMTYDFANMVHHTCQREGASSPAPENDDAVCISIEDEIKAYVDDLAEQDLSAKKIWSMAFEKFYSNATSVVRGLSRKQVVSRVGNANARPNAFALLETREMARVKDNLVGFLQFKYTWHDDTRLKQGKSGFKRLFGWAHPELRNLLRYAGVHLFVDGTFRCCPKAFGQFVTLMMYDPLTDLFVAVFFTLATNKTKDLYNKMYKCIEFALGKKPNPVDVVCDSEAAMIFAVREHFPSTRIVGCLFHFKQACRRKMKEFRLSDPEAGVAMEFGVLDMLTVIRPDTVAVQGVAWVKCKIKERCQVKGLAYSRGKWKRFWKYFAGTWLDTYPPDLWNIYGVQRSIMNRTNNPLERFHRELNARMKPHPTLKRFVRVIEEIAREYVVHRASIISGVASAPVRPNMRFPRAATLPDPRDILDSDSEEDADDVGATEDEGVEEAEEDLGIVYDNAFDYEEEKQSEDDA